MTQRFKSISGIRRVFEGWLYWWMIEIQSSSCPSNCGVIISVIVYIAHDICFLFTRQLKPWVISLYNWRFLRNNCLSLSVTAFVTSSRKSEFSHLQRVWDDRLLLSEQLANAGKQVVRTVMIALGNIDRLGPVTRYSRLI